MKVKPYGKRLLVKVDEQRKQTETGIIIPDTVHEGEHVMKATVLDVGKKCEPIKEGDRVLFSRNRSAVIDKEENYHIVGLDEILGYESI